MADIRYPVEPLTQFAGDLLAAAGLRTPRHKLWRACLC